MRLIISILALGAVTRAATAEICEDSGEDKTITRKSIAKLTRSGRVAIVQLDVLVERDNVVAASLSAKARGNFGGSDNEAKWADVETSGAKRLRCEGGEASQCSAWLPRTVNGTGHTGPSEFCATSI